VNTGPSTFAWQRARVHRRWVRALALASATALGACLLLSSAPSGARSLGAGQGLGVDNHDFRLILQQTVSGNHTENLTTVNADVAMDPGNHARLVAVAQTGEFWDGGAAWEDYAISLDGGSTWSGGHVPGVTKAGGGRYPRVDDPRVAIGPDGTVYVLAMVFDPATCSSALVLSTLSSVGWHTPRRIVAESRCGTNLGRPALAVSSGHVFAAWDNGGARIEVVSTARGRRTDVWSRPVPASPHGVVGVAPVLLVEPTGRLVVYYSRPDVGEEVIQASDSFGHRFGAIRIVHDFRASNPDGYLTGNELGIGDAAVDPVTGDLYVVWDDDRYDRNGTNAVVMSRSEDGGRTWLGPKTLSGQQPPGSAIDRFTPSVAAYGGFVTATWYHLWVGDPLHQNKLNRGFAYSDDRGHHWSHQYMIGCGKRPLEIDVSHAATVDGLLYFGERSGLATDATSAHPAWVVAGHGPDRYRQGVWTATMTYLDHQDGAKTFC